MSEERNKEIHSKGFNMSRYQDYKTAAQDYKSIKVGVKTLEDATMNLGSFKQPGKNISNPNFANTNYIFHCLLNKDANALRNLSDFYYRTNGIYRRICDYFAFLYRYDWYVIPKIREKDGLKVQKLLEDLNLILDYLDNSQIKKTCGDIALKVITKGVYYGYIVPSSDRLVLQDLPELYCRSLYSINGSPAVEFNMKYFDTFTDINYRLKVLNLFPDEFKKGYQLYKTGKLIQDSVNVDRTIYSDNGWYLLDPQNSVKFNFNESDVPIFANVIPSLIELDAAQDLDRRKQMQKLLKIIVQKLPLDKNGDLIFDIDEAKDLHSNAVEMLSRAIGVDVLTTFADVESIDMADKNTATTTDDLERVERAVYNNVGTSRDLFNTDGNLSLDKSILNDESSVRNLLFQFDIFFDKITKAIGNIGKKKYNFQFYMLETTQYNYKDLSKLYKEMVQLGYSKMLPQIALGHSQSFILNAAYFENDILNLSEIMIPPLMSSTLNGQDILGKKQQTGNQQNQKITEEKKNGRPEKPDDQKSEKTIANKESMG